MERLLAEEQLAISEVEKSLRELESIEENYNQLLERLENLPKKIRHPVTVPLNSVGFFQGELVHTNEITVLLSSDYLVEVSASKASEIAARRVEECRKRQRQAKKQIKNLSEWKNVTQIGIDESSKAVDINEEFDEAKEAEWREAHSKRVREERQRERASTSKGEKDDSKWLDRLEELEMLEELDGYSATSSLLPSGSDALIPAVKSLAIDEPSSSGGISGKSYTTPEGPRPPGAMKWNPSSGGFESFNKRQQGAAKEKVPVVVDSDDNEEPEDESDDAEASEAFPGLVLERDTSGKIVTSVGEAPARQSRFKTSRR